MLFQAKEKFLGRISALLDDLSIRSASGWRRRRETELPLGREKGIKLRCVGGNLLCTLTSILQTHKLIEAIQDSLNHGKVLLAPGLKGFNENTL